MEVILRVQLHPNIQLYAQEYNTKACTPLIGLLSSDWSFELNKISHRHITMGASYVTIVKAVMGVCFCWLIALILDWLLSVTYIKLLTN